MSTDNHPEFELERLQQWLQAVIVHPGGAASGLEAPAARKHVDVAIEEIESVVTRSQALSGVERLEIYSRAYFARLLECLRSQFPMLARALGEELFDKFAAGYLEQHPSQSYTLSRLGERFVEYLSATRPADSSAAWPDWLIDLARLEWEFDQVFDGPGVENLPPLASDEIVSIPVDRWPHVKLVPSPCLRVQSFSYPVHGYYRALRRGEAAAPPQPETTHLAISRRDYVVRYFPLDNAQHALLSAMLRGAPLGEAIELVAGNNDDFELLAAQLRAWFELWTVERFFSRIEQPECEEHTDDG